MTLCNKVKKFAKKAVVSGAILSAFLFGGNKEAKAQDLNDLLNPPRIERKQEIPKRKFTLEFKNPLFDFDTNSRAWYSANQYIGKFSDHLGINSGFDKNIFGRIGLSILNAWWNMGTSYVSHEVGHDIFDTRNGVNHPFDFDFSDWSFFFPLYIQEGVFSKTISSVDDMIFLQESGLYQEEFNASFAFKERVLKNFFVCDEGFTYLMPKLRDIVYTLNHISDLPEQYLVDDVNMYTRLMRFDKGIHYSNFDYFKYAMITDLLSFSTWESLEGIFDYIATGRRYHEVGKIEFKDFNIVPPNLRLLASKDGFYIDMEMPIDFKNGKYLFIYLGTGIDSFGDSGEVDTIRFGGQYHGISIKDPSFHLEISPFVYLNCDRKKFYSKGYSIGCDAEFFFSDDIRLFFRFIMNKNDMLENKIKSEKDGFKARVGVNIKY